MRITNNMIVSRQLDGLQANATAMDRAQAAVTSGKRLTSASADPSAASQIMASSSSLRSLEQYRANVQRATSRVGVEDGVLQQMGDLVTRAKELGIAQSAGGATAQTRGVANAEVGQLFQQVVELGNTKFGNEYLFGGDESTTRPFDASGSGATLDYTTTGAQGARSVAIGDGQVMTTAHDGKQIFVDSGVLDAMRDLSRALDPSSGTYGTPGISAALTKLDDAFNSVQSLVGDVGAESQRLEVTGQNLDAYKTNLSVLKSDLEDVDIETAVTELTSRQMAYQAALLATSKVLSMNLTDYLK
jgi:flagellar hook-associated protein 3 FlgL